MKPSFNETHPWMCEISGVELVEQLIYITTGLSSGENRRFCLDILSQEWFENTVFASFNDRHFSNKGKSLLPTVVLNVSDDAN